jgi:acyl-CoA thioesterase I
LPCFSGNRPKNALGAPRGARPLRHRIDLGARLTILRTRYTLIAMKKLFILTLLALLSPALCAKTVLILGDSLSAAYGLQQSEGWVALMQKEFAAKKPQVQVVNGSVSGDTTANGLARLPFLLKQHKPSTVVIALGANDALRGQSIKTLTDNLDAMIALAQKNGAKVAILGIQMPPNLGPQYNTQMQAAFLNVSVKHKLPLNAHLLAPLGTGLEMFQRDTIHPTAVAQPLILKHILPTIEKAL